jgi:hypothetical protein
MSRITFHQLCRAGFESRMARTGQDEDDLAQMVRDHFDADITGDEIRAMHHDGYSSHFLDMIAATAGCSTLDLIAQSLQTFLPGPHVGCPTCVCGIPREERETLAARFLYNGDPDGFEALAEIRAARGDRQAIDCDCGPSLP